MSRISDFGAGMVVGALLSLVAAIIDSSVLPSRRERERACRAELALAQSAQDTLAVALRNRKCLELVGAPSPQEAQ